MNQQLFVWLSEWTLLAFLFGAFIVVVAASIYDIRQKLRSESMNKLASNLRGRRLPFITVLVYTKMSDNSVINCLDGIRKNRYAHYDVVVVDDSLSVGIKRLIKTYKQKHSSMPVRIYSKRYSGDKIEALQKGYNRSQKGDLILVVDASNIIPVTLLRSSAVKFLSNHELNVLRFNIQNEVLDSITLIYYRFLRLSMSLLNKYLSITSQYKIAVSETGVMYRRNTFSNALKAAIVGVYDSGLTLFDSSVGRDRDVMKNIIFRQETIQKSGGLRRAVIFLVVLIAASLQAYSMYIAATHQSTTLLILGWSAISVWLLIATWSNDAMNIFEKIKLAFCIPTGYFLVFCQLVLYIIIKIVMLISEQTQQVFSSFRKTAYRFL